MWLRTLLDNLSLKQMVPTSIEEDNQGTIALTKNPQFHWWSKHYNPKLYYICEKISEKAIDVKYCSTGQMTADVLTKSLGKPTHDTHVKNLSMALDWRGVLSMVLSAILQPTQVAVTLVNSDLCDNVTRHGAATHPHSHVTLQYYLLAYLSLHSYSQQFCSTCHSSFKLQDFPYFYYDPMWHWAFEWKKFDATWACCLLHKNGQNCMIMHDNTW